MKIGQDKERRRGKDKGRKRGKEMIKEGEEEG